MQDNRWDDQFTDQAWSEMRKLLDREMPVRGAWFIRRRWMGAAAAVLLLLLAAGGAYWWRPETPSPVAETVPLVPRGEAGAADNSLSDGKRSGKENPDAESSDQVAEENSGRRSEVRENAIARLATADAARSSNQETTRVQTPASATSSSSFPLIAEGEKGITETQAATTLENGATNPVDPAKESASLADLSGQTTAVDAFLAALPLPAADVDRPVDPLDWSAPVFAEPMAPQSTAASSLLPDRWGLQGSTVAGGSGLTGLAAGLAADYRLGESRWTVQTGLRYLYQNRDFAFQAPGGPGSSSITEDNRGPNGPSQDTLSTAGNRAFNPQSFPVAALTHSLNLPVVLHYRAGKRLGLQMGLQMSYALLTQRTNGSSVFTSTGSFAGNNLASTDTGTFQLVTTPADNTFKPSLLQRWDLGLTGGLQFQALPRLDLQMRYNFGLVDLVRSEYYAAYNRFFSLGVIYYVN